MWIEEVDGSSSKERSGINERFLPGIDTSTRLFALSHCLERTILEYLAIANILAGPVNRRKHFTLSKCWLHSLRLSAVCRFVSTALRWNTVSGNFNEAPRGSVDGTKIAVRIVAVRLIRDILQMIAVWILRTIFAIFIDYALITFCNYCY